VRFYSQNPYLQTWLAENKTHFQADSKQIQAKSQCSREEISFSTFIAQRFG
jgi:hypothetical protein